MISIYGLVDPRDGRVRYVGKAKDANARLLSHIHTRRSRRTPVYRWICELANQGLLPTLQILETVEDSAWQEAERRLIAKFKTLTPDLLNVARGGNAPAQPADEFSQRVRLLKKNVKEMLRSKYLPERAKENLLAAIRYAAWKRPEIFKRYAISLGVWSGGEPIERAVWQ